MLNPQNHNRMSIISLIIQREFIAKVRNKSFIVMTFLSPLLFVFLAVFVGYLSTMKADQKAIAVNDASGLFVNDFKNSEQYKYTNVTTIPLKITKAAIKNNQYEGLILIPNYSKIPENRSEIQYISDESPSPIYINDLQKIINKKITNLNYKTLKIDTLALHKAASNVEIKLKKASGEDTVKGLNYIKMIIGGTFGYLIMMFIILYGNMVMRSVIEEKTSRIIEIIISSVKPFQLMMGKIIGTSLAGILQFIIWAILGLAAMLILSLFFHVPIGSTSGVQSQIPAVAQAQITSTMQLYINEIWHLPLATIIVSFLLYFIGGYFLYSSFYAAIGAAVDNETDSQQFLLPIIMPLVLGVYIGFFTVINDPQGTVATIFSLIPLTAPIVMMMRIPFGVPWWQIALSLTILFGTFFTVVVFASKIYRIGILMYGKKPTWSQLLKWIRV